MITSGIVATDPRSRRRFSTTSEDLDQIQDFPGLENAILKSKNFPGSVSTLTEDSTPRKSKGQPRLNNDKHRLQKINTESAINTIFNTVHTNASKHAYTPVTQQPITICASV